MCPGMDHFWSSFLDRENRKIIKNMHIDPLHPQLRWGCWWGNHLVISVWNYMLSKSLGCKCTYMSIRHFNNAFVNLLGFSRHFGFKNTKMDQHEIVSNVSPCVWKKPNCLLIKSKYTCCGVSILVLGFNCRSGIYL